MMHRLVCIQTRWSVQTTFSANPQLTTCRERGVACACDRYASYGLASAASASEQPMSSAAMRYTCTGFQQALKKERYVVRVPPW